MLAHLYVHSVLLLGSVMQARLAKIDEDWMELVTRSKDKSTALQEARRQAEFNAGLKDIEFWLGEVEQLLENDDLGRDLMSVRNLVRLVVVDCYYWLGERVRACESGWVRERVSGSESQ